MKLQDEFRAACDSTLKLKLAFILLMLDSLLNAVNLARFVVIIFFPLKCTTNQTASSSHLKENYCTLILSYFISSANGFRKVCLKQQLSFELVKKNKKNIGHVKPTRGSQN